MSMKSRTEDILILYAILIERLHDREPSMRLYLHVYSKQSVEIICFSLHL